MKRILIILLIFAVLNFLVGCENMRNIDPLKQENIKYYQNTIQLFAKDNKYNAEFVTNEKLDDDVALEGEIKLDEECGWITVIIYEDGMVDTDLFLKDKTHLVDYLNLIIELSNSLSKRQFTLDEIQEFLTNDSYTVTNDPDYIYKEKSFGWMMDSTVSYSERENSASITICTGIIH